MTNVTLKSKRGPNSRLVASDVLTDFTSLTTNQSFLQAKAIENTKVFAQNVATTLYYRILPTKISIWISKPMPIDPNGACSLLNNLSVVASTNGRLLKVPVKVTNLS